MTFAGDTDSVIHKEPRLRVIWILPILRDVLSLLSCLSFLRVHKRWRLRSSQVLTFVTVPDPANILVNLASVKLLPVVLANAHKAFFDLILHRRGVILVKVGVLAHDDLSVVNGRILSTPHSSSLNLTIEVAMHTSCRIVGHLVASLL